MLADVGKDYQDFAIDLVTEMQKQIAETGTDITDLIVRDAVKVNDGNAKCITATFNDGGNVSPSIYVRPMYEAYCHGDTIEELADKGIRVLEAGRENSIGINLDSVMPRPEDAHKRLYLQLINGEANPDIKERCPHIELNDLIAVARWKCFDNSEAGSGSILITHDIQTGVLHMTADEVLKLARDNTLSQEYTIKGMSETLRELMGGEGMSEEMMLALFPTPDEPEQMYVLSNAEKLNGATALLSKDTLAEARDIIGTDFYIIPSSLNEVICVPESFVSNPRDLQNMCKEVNETQVALQERLGDNIYFCDGRNITICNSLEQLHDIKESAVETVKESISVGIGRRI